ncbi:hypothetical protein CKQ53_01250 [Lonsdalea britannica]|uniref:Uncharacterized protein n=1 Tax=Lonsdalea britannica TaxID=1082704 RepID=A0AAD0SCY1_9GAMM|nr:hypothetical protein CKQ53_01250 [Lonsdalea britannica]
MYCSYYRHHFNILKHPNSFIIPLFYKIFLYSARPFDPDPKPCSIQKQNSGLINTPLNGGGADEKITIH